jgi:transposase
MNNLNVSLETNLISHVRVKLAKTYQKLTDVRNDHYHKLSRTLVNESQVIVVER